MVTVSRVGMASASGRAIAVAAAIAAAPVAIAAILAVARTTATLPATILSAAGALVAGKPGAHRGQFLAGRDAALVLAFFPCGLVGLQHVAVDVAARRAAPALATAGEIIRPHPI